MADMHEMQFTRPKEAARATVCHMHRPDAKLCRAGGARTYMQWLRSRHLAGQTGALLLAQSGSATQLRLLR